MIACHQIEPFLWSKEPAGRSSSALKAGRRHCHCDQRRAPITILAAFLGAILDDQTPRRALRWCKFQAFSPHSDRQAIVHILASVWTPRRSHVSNKPTMTRVVGRMSSARRVHDKPRRPGIWQAPVASDRPPRLLSPAFHGTDESMFYIWINRQFMRDKTWTLSAAAEPLAFGWGVKVSSSS
ncbi:hypothetical protein BDP81DRAFT_161354 [Colletotrichum phormii]|uniref:Uncharacterized protein n=1 Tax=Colletotrichum phormii TaxID=359342 RepID=A0AAJ0EIT2_9PEZI|nr:uncharacterized protein BDP81DRAFT_161354 [Colletotrichum phormii]KAK1640314.1 hypothetical protein BDP81DRAFT_161354 [Colletotrichum phormii]